MNDKDLIGLVARIWVENGGDGLGFVYCYDKILTAILEKLKEEHDTLQEKQKEINPDNNSDKVSGLEAKE